MMRALLDTNVILDSLLQRAPWHVEADAILQAVAQGRLTCAATTLSIANLFYVGRRIVGGVQARSDVRKCLNAFEILPVDRQTLTDAEALVGSDFEDNIQIAAAVLQGVDAIVTRDPSGFSQSPLPVLSPAELLQQLSRQPLQ